MQLNLNKVLAAGRLTRDPEIRPAGSTKVAKFTLVINRSFKRGDEWVEDPVFIDCELWDTGAERFVTKAQKGTLIVVEASLKQDNWEDKDTGAKRSKLGLRVSQFWVLDRGRDGVVDEAPAAEGGSEAPKAPAKSGSTKKAAKKDESADEEVPF